jgi:hypothetical protein
LRGEKNFDQEQEEDEEIEVAEDKENLFDNATPTSSTRSTPAPTPFGRSNKRKAARIDPVDAELLAQLDKTKQGKKLR